MTRCQERSGGSLSAGNVGHEGWAELLIGVRGRDVNGISDAGAIGILIGRENGLSAVATKWLDMGSLAAPNAFFGNSLSIGNFGGDSYLDLAVGVPYADVGSLVDAGSVHIRYGNPNGPSINNTDVMILPGVPQTTANFGFALPNGGN